jgi:hypothetical protein
MSQVVKFIDGENIVIIDNVPHYRCAGSTYKDKLKNGLSFDYVFEQQDMILICPEETTETNETRENLCSIDYEEICEFYEQKKNQVEGITRKGKRVPFKKRQPRIVNKNRVRQRGYEDKLFDIEQNMPNLFDKKQNCKWTCAESVDTFCPIEFDICATHIRQDDDNDDWSLN